MADDLQAILDMVQDRKPDPIAVIQDSLTLRSTRESVARGGFDGNECPSWPKQYSRWWEEKPRLSYRLFGRPLTFTRVQYDYLHYADASSNYWTPQHWELLSPVPDTAIPLERPSISIWTPGPCTCSTPTDSAFNFWADRW
jgi:hypothetical protein